jgi:hypothetical protein
LAGRDIAKNSSGRNLAAMRRNYLTAKHQSCSHGVERADGQQREQPSTAEASPHGQVGKSLRNVWRTFWSCSLLLLGPELLSPGLQGQVPCEVGEGSCADAKVVWLFNSGDRQVKSAPDSYAIPRRVFVWQRPQVEAAINGAGVRRDDDLEPHKTRKRDCGPVLRSYRAAGRCDLRGRRRIERLVLECPRRPGLLYRRLWRRASSTQSKSYPAAVRYAARFPSCFSCWAKICFR